VVRDAIAAFAIEAVARARAQAVRFLARDDLEQPLEALE
jgi:hypothetical protein